jgi:hypothetical protein
MGEITWENMREYDMKDMTWHGILCMAWDINHVGKDGYATRKMV